MEGWDPQGGVWLLWAWCHAPKQACGVWVALQMSPLLKRASSRHTRKTHTHLALACIVRYQCTSAIAKRHPLARFQVDTTASSIHFRGLIATPDGKCVHRLERSVDAGDEAEAIRLGAEAGEQLKQEACPGFFLW